jgi:hypothetical protein
VRAEIEKHYAEKTPNFRCAVYEDFRVMLEKEKAIDAVLIATPDHQHAHGAILAMKAGKHVYCEKPLTHNIREARLVARVAQETGVATQMGNQGRSGEGHRQTVEWLADGAIGAVREVHAWSGGPAWAATRSSTRSPRSSRPGSTGTCGSGRARAAVRRRYRALHLALLLGLRERAMPDMGIHHVDPAFNALDLDGPTLVEGPARRYDPETVVGSHFMTLRCPPKERAGRHRVLVRRRAAAAGAAGIDPDDPQQRLGEGDNGIVIVGEKGILTAAAGRACRACCRSTCTASYRPPAKTLPRVAGHHADWIQACKGGTKPCSNFEYGARLTEFMLLGTLALRARKPIKWDAANMRASNAPDVQPIIEGTYRPGWELPV